MEDNCCKRRMACTRIFKFRANYLYYRNTWLELGTVNNTSTEHVLYLQTKIMEIIQIYISILEDKEAMIDTEICTDTHSTYKKGI